jgi:flagellar biosynthesis chaperone FliJ
MNWTTLLRFRKQVEDLAREEVVLAEWEKSQELTKRYEMTQEMESVVAELEQKIQIGIDTLFAEERYRWLDQLGTAMEERMQEIQRLEETLVGLREKLKKAYHARRVVELVIAKKEAAILKKVAVQEQRIQEDVSAHAFATSNLEEMTQ